MNSIHKLFHYIAGLIIFAGAFTFVGNYVDMAEQREDYVIMDQVKKTGVELNIDASGGSNKITSTQVLTNLLALPDTISISINGNAISHDVIYGIIARGATSINSLVAPGNYVAYYSFNASGELVSVNYIATS